MIRAGSLGDRSPCCGVESAVGAAVGVALEVAFEMLEASEAFTLLLELSVLFD